MPGLESGGGGGGGVGEIGGAITAIANGTGPC